MNTTSNRITRNTALAALVGAAVLALSGPALAGEATYELPQKAVVTHSRADVHAQVLQARAAGLLPLTEARLQKSDPFEARKSRADVQAEARDAGDTAAAYGEPHDFDTPVRAAGGRNVARVVAAR